MTTRWLPRASVMVGWALVAVALTGCADPAPPADHFYRLRLADPPVPAATVVLPGGIEVERPVADGEIGNRAIVRVSADGASELRPFAYHFWAAPPANMLQDLLVRCLVDGEVSDRVTVSEQRIDTRYTLLARVRHLEMETSAPRRVVLALDLALRDDPARRLLMTQTFRAEAVPADDTVGAAVDAFGGAFSTVCQDLVVKLSRR